MSSTTNGPLEGALAATDTGAGPNAAPDFDTEADLVELYLGDSPEVSLDDALANIYRGELLGEAVRQHLMDRYADRVRQFIGHRSSITIYRAVLILFGKGSLASEVLRHLYQRTDFNPIRRAEQQLRDANESRS